MPHEAILQRCADPDRWNALALTQPGGTAFHEWSFIDFAERLTGLHVDRLLVVVAGEPVGILPVVRRARRHPLGEWMPFPFLGPAVPVEHLAATFRAVRRWQLRAGLLLARFDIAPSLAGGVHAAAGSAGMLVDDDFTMVVDIAHGSLSDLAASMSDRRRRYIRAAERKGVESRPARPGETAALLGRLLASAYRRHDGSSPYPDDVGAQFESWATGRDDVRVVTTLVDGRPVGLIVGLGWHPVAMSWVGAVLPDALDSHAGDLQYRDLMAWATERGNRQFDFVGRVDDAVERYKATLGGVRAPYARVGSALAPTVVTRALRARRGPFDAGVAPA